VRRFWFEILEGIRIAGWAIWANRLRAVLTTLGIIIGIASVTTMATVINGVDQEFESTLSQLGTDVVYVSKWPWGNNAGLDWWNYINRPQIDPGLAEVVMERSRTAAFSAPMTDTDRTASYKGRDLRANILGSTPDYGRIRTVNLAEGRFFTASDERGARNVCVLGATVSETLFPIETPLGKQIRVGGLPCRVIGVREEMGQGLFGGDISDDERILVPFSTFRKLFGISQRRDVTLMVKARAGVPLATVKDELTGVLRTARRVEPGAESNFEINDQDQIRSTFTGVKIAIYGVGLFLTALALLVGGIGVMNIMFVSVRERTKEIGIRKAVGAKRRTILLQFLVEAVIVCLIGGFIGVALSAGLMVVVSALGLTAVMPLSTVLVAFSICVGVGIAFGIVPAWQAATAEPIDALRYE